MGLKKKRPGIATAKPATKLPRKSPAPKECCGALRGHKPDCTGSAGEDLFDGGPVETSAEDTQFIDDTVARVASSPQVADGAVIAALRGIEEALVRLADTVDTIKVIVGSKVNEDRLKDAPGPAPVQATPPKVRKAKAETAPVAVEPEPETTTPAPVAAPVEKKPAPAVKPVAVSLEQVRSEFLAFASKKGRDEAVAILGRFGAPKVGDLPADQYPAFLSALRGA